MNSKERVLRMVTGQTVDRLPVMPITMMFAADYCQVPYGRYATDYRVLVEAQLRVADQFDFDHVSCISDPAREAADCGAVIAFFENQPPAIREECALLADKSKLVTLKCPNPYEGKRMHDRIRAAALFKEKVGNDKFIEGWIEGPCAEGADLRGINALMMDFIEDPDFVEDLFSFVLEMELSFAKAQIEAGVDIIGVGDAAASLVGPFIYEHYVWPYEKRLVDGIKALGGRVRLHICGNTLPILEGLGRLGCDIVDLDWMVPIRDARTQMGPQQVLAGNADPIKVVRNGTLEQVIAVLRQCHEDAGDKYILAAGCEIPRDAPLGNVTAFKDYARHTPGCL